MIKEMYEEESQRRERINKDVKEKTYILIEQVWENMTKEKVWC